jgi:hypothetical protein
MQVFQEDLCVVTFQRFITTIDQKAACLLQCVNATIFNNYDDGLKAFQLCTLANQNGSYKVKICHQFVLFLTSILKFYFFKERDTEKRYSNNNKRYSKKFN